MHIRIFFMFPYDPAVFVCVWFDIFLYPLYISEGSLHNPALFDGVNPPVWDMMNEYLDLAAEYSCNLTYVRGHVFKMCIHAYVSNKLKA